MRSVHSRSVRVLLLSAVLVVAGGVYAAAAIPAVTVSQPVSPSPSAPTRAADPIAHDPTMVKEGDWFYVVITGDTGRLNTFLPVKRSKDLVHWTELAPVFSTLPSWILPALGLGPADAPKDLWAPDLSYVNGEWRLYYAISQFGKNNSVIGLATTKSLDPASKDFGWVDKGLVLQSKPTGASGEYNAIDADYTTDAQGHGWLSFGSFWTGIKMRSVDVATGKLSRTDTTVHDLATRPAPPDAIEGPSVVRHGAYYYLFVAFDYCCRGADSDYRVMVGRSTSITGPYVDRAGVPMLQGGGTEILRGYNEFQGTGGADVYSVDGTDYFVNHYYDATDNGTPKLNVRTLQWPGGWPQVSDPVNPSSSIGHGSAYVAIVPRGSAGVVQDEGCGYEGAPLALAAYTGTSCQQWQIDGRGSGARILNRYSNKVAEIAGCNNVDGAPLAQWGWVGFLANNDCQRWTMTPAADGYVAIAAVAPGHRVWQTSSVRVDLQVDTVTDPIPESEQFRLEPLGDVLLAGTGAQSGTMGVTGCSDVNGHYLAFSAQVRMQPRSASGCQEWHVDSIGGAAQYTVTNVKSGKQLAAVADRRGIPGLQVVRPGSANLAARTWRLTPEDDGSWTLTGARTSIPVRVLVP